MRFNLCSNHVASRPQTRSLLKSIPYRVWRGHKEDVLDVAWSRTQFLLSSSMDQTVRLWHVSMAECLRIFTHPDFVTAIDFHPINDKVELNHEKPLTLSGNGLSMKVFGF